jgi:hypothetical protein
MRGAANLAAVIKSGYMLERLSIRRYEHGFCVRENPVGAVNQQERLAVEEQKRWFLAGLIEGEGSLCVSIKAHKPSRFGYLVDPEFFVYQHKNRRGLLELAQHVFQTGRISPKHGNEDVLVYAITSRRSIAERVIPFYERYMAFSFKKRDFQLFRDVVVAIGDGRHKDPHGLIEIVEKAYQMNMEGKQRKRPMREVTERILRDYTPDTGDSVGEDIVPSAWRHAG